MIKTTDRARTSTCTSREDIPMDAHLPQLLTIVDPEAMRERFWAGMFESSTLRDRFLIRHCDIIQIRYKPASSCMVSYRLDIENIETGERGEQILCGRAFPKGRSQAQWEKAGTRALVQPRFGTPLVYLPDLEMVLWSFPNDRKMHTLPAAILTDSSIPAFLPDWLVGRLGPGWRVVGATSKVIHYVGEHTCTVRTSVELVNIAQRIDQTMTLFGKTYYDEEGAQTDRVMRQLWDSESRRSGRLGMAEPLWYDGRLRTLWQRGIQGATLENDGIESSESLSRFAEAAHAIGTFHGTRLSDIRLVTIPHLIEKLGAVGSVLMRSRPTCEPVLVPLLARLTAQVKMVPANQTATLHGDLHLKNLFLTTERIALIDLDNVCEGPPGLDIGSFIAGLLTRALAKGSSLSQVTRHLDTFLDHYNQCVAWNVDRPTVAWFTAVALVIERAHRCITRMKDDRRGQLEALLSLADRISESLSLESLADGWIETDERSRQL